MKMIRIFLMIPFSQIERSKRREQKSNNMRNIFVIASFFLMFRDLITIKIIKQIHFLSEILNLKMEKCLFQYLNISIKFK